MTTKTILSAIFCFCNLYSISQKAFIQCTNQHNPDKSISIYANAQVYADYTLRIIFSSLNGYTSRSLYSSNIALAVVNRGTTEVMKLIPDNSMNPIFQYKHQFFPGHSFQKMPDTSFQYLLPASEGNKVRVSSVSSTIGFISQKLGIEFRGTSFLYKLADTICACRAGTVFDCSDTVTVGEAAEVAMKSGRNRILIEHRDGTLGTYAVTAPMKLLVALGDEVFPGQPLAVFTKESPRYMLIFSIQYLDEKKLMTMNTADNAIYYNYVPTYFYASDNEKSSILERTKQYTVQHPREIIAAEMTKKEKRKFGF